MTSNLGSQAMQNNKALGFTSAEATDVQQKNDYEALKKNVMGYVKKAFRPEFINRIDDIVVFHPLTDTEIEQIVGLMLGDLRKRLAEQDMTLEISEEALKAIAKVGFDPEYGARPLRRAIQNEVEDLLSDALLAGTYTNGDVIQIDADAEGKIVLKNK